MNALIWNIRSVNTMEDFPRLIKLKHKYNLGFIGLLEPFQQPDKIEEHRRRLGMQTALANEDIVITVVYARCTQRERLELWDSLEDVATNMNKPGMIGGDFNVIMSEEEKYGGLAVGANETQDFNLCMQNCEMQDFGFKGRKYTWWNGQSGEDYIFKRIDRCLGNLGIQQMYPGIEVNHLIRIGSDHALLLISYAGNNMPIKQPFKFLNFWEIETLEDVIKVHEVQFELQPTLHNRERLQRVQADLNRYLHLEEEFWKQKAGMQWFNDGDRNTRFFHAYVQGRRKRLQLRRIQDQQGTWLEDPDAIVTEAINFFTTQFIKEEDPDDFEILDQLPTLISEDQIIRFWRCQQNRG
ncbi:uncharacterized protein LOC132042405 [Lycium ferocissimum]|uniref:uncharacterized protein LOC132042405 n=1 Tax=Lycium ferocissimum TaxID=112874 RepID=UPI0028168CEE|nr:uncharacterized protein LOC132042405 [Lycium ferocissimum]